MAFSAQACWPVLRRGSTWTALSFFASQGVRFGANLIMTRLLFPEAFGIMALVTVLLVGMTMISDMGIAQSVMQSKRGDDPDFLDTAWTLQIIRGALLWGIACALAVPAANFYGQPDIALFLPVAGAALLLKGLEPIRVETANRHLTLGRVMALDLLATVLGIVSMVVIAWITQSTWSLVAGWSVTAALRLALMWLFLPGPGNRLRWERSAGRELVNFGIWLFLSSICGLLASQGDRAILGKFLSIDGLGIYNIGMFLASFPLMLGMTITSRILIPLYREHLNAEDQAARRRLFKLRYGLTGLMLLVLFGLALSGPWLVEALYDDRYLTAGGIIVALASVQMLTVVSLTYDQAALATGDSKGFFWVSATKATAHDGRFLDRCFDERSLRCCDRAGDSNAGVPSFHRAFGTSSRGVGYAPRLDVFAACRGVGGLAIWVNYADVLLLLPQSSGGLYGD